MQYLHVKNLDKYNPGYKDRNLLWCKIYFSMINSSYEFENIDDIDKWRLIALIMLELQTKKPIPYDEKWLHKKISNSNRSISKTINMLHNFIDIVTEDLKTCVLEKKRKEKNREDSTHVTNNFSFDDIWKKYPKKVGKKEAIRHFNASVKNEDDFKKINFALDNYLRSERVSKGFTQNASTWFNNWNDWIEYKEEICKKCNNKGKFISKTGYEIICDCPKGLAIK